MCNVFSGLIVTKGGKEWGKIIFDGGVHHEKDKEKYFGKYGDEVLAWESNKIYSLSDGFHFTHNINVGAKESAALLGLVEDWGKKQCKEKLLRSMVTVVKNNKPSDDFEIIDNMMVAGDGVSMVCDFTAYQTAGDRSTQKAGYESTQTAGDGSTQKAGDESTQKAGYRSTQTAGNWSTQTAGNWSTQKAGYRSTQTAGYGSTQTAGDGSNCIIWGDTSYIILAGKNVTLIQKWWEKGKHKQAIVDVNKLFEKHKVGDKIKIVKGKEGKDALSSTKTECDK